MTKYYKERLEEEGASLVELEKKSSTTSNIRLFAIIAGAVLLYFLFKTSAIIAFGTILGILAGFYFLVRYHESVQEKVELKKVLIDVLRNELEVCSGGKNKYAEGADFYDEKHDYTADLDVFGNFSLFHLINRAKTRLGQLKLANAFLETHNSEIIQKRQAASKELLGKTVWRQSFQASLFELSGSSVTELSILGEPPAIKLEGLIKYYAFLKWIFVGGVVAVFYFYGVTNGMIALVGLLALNYSLVGINKKVTEPYFNKIKGLSRDMAKYKTATQLVLEENWETELLKNAQVLLPVDGKNPIEEFQLISTKIDMKNNQFASFFLYAFSPFDLVQLVKLRAWVKKNPSFFEEIFECLGTFEQFASVATLAFNRPNWTFPELKDDDQVSVSASEIGHPLMPESVSNSYILSPQNRLSLITGSNMSGKSTFLRTLGSNILLAYAGAPIFAERFVLNSGIKLFAYMRIKDSLEQNSSTFKAEIDRIKILLEAMSLESKALLLVDEMLRGTNSEDKLKGSIAFLERVIKSDSYALVATHDLRMTEIADKYPEKSKNYFFEYDAKDGELTFDYKLKPGICESFNASELLRSVGLDV
ncbi:hypothetical protein [uncultured Arcticibacterium sp.]|uniref:MutS-related protein n=1 Tax=uncultured Arcticibacterium sp. TaxID=2173042 RepID=UPI0030FC6A70